MSAKQSWNEENACRNALRRVFSRSPIVQEILKEGKRTSPRYKKDGTRHKVDAAEYLCQVCNMWVNSTHIEVDHIVPVVNIEEGYLNILEFKKRLFCGKENLQRICLDCHQKKSNIENAKRRLIKDRATLTELEKQLSFQLLKTASCDQGFFKKQLAKYLTKEKPEEIRQRALRLKEKILQSFKKTRKREYNSHVSRSR